MKFASRIYSFQEVPGEFSLCFLISGCPLRCAGCHSAWARNPEYGEDLTSESLINEIEKGGALLSCVCFLGGEWQVDELIVHLKAIQSFGLRTCLYTGLELEEVDDRILQHLNYIKVGPYIEAQGGLLSKNTNQKFIHLR